MHGDVPDMIAVDWGTTSFRAYRLGPDGGVLDQTRSAAGILSIEAGGFSAVLDKHVGSWINGGSKTPIIMSGMIGSRQGWIEAPYISMPASLDDIAAGLASVPHDGPANVLIVPGLSLDTGAMPDVMRGEETQIYGAMRLHGQANSTFVLPGTHSKWVSASDGQIRQFATYMTGEVFAALSGHTILGRLMAERAELHPEGFRQGLDDGRAAGEPGALLHRLFGARTRALFGQLAADAVADYLSGMLIGAEFADAASRFDRPIFIVGASGLAERYLLAAERFGLAAERIDPDCAAAGLYAIACRAGLMDPGKG